MNSLAMGETILSILAQLAMKDLEITQKKLNFLLPFYYRYVNDFILLAPKTEVTKLLKLLIHKYHPKFQFTIELEKLNKFP